MVDKKIITRLSIQNGEVKTCMNPLPSIQIKGMSEQCDLLNTWSPAHLLVTAVESCFYLTMQSIAEKMRIEILSYESSAEGTIFSEDGKHKQISQVTIKPVIKLKNEADRSKLGLLFQKSEEYCFIARSVKAKIIISE